MGVATTFLPTGVDPATVTSPYALLDKFNDDASTQVSDIMKEASMFRLDLLLAAVDLLDRLSHLPLHRAIRRHASRSCS